MALPVNEIMAQLQGRGAGRGEDGLVHEEQDGEELNEGELNGEELGGVEGVAMEELGGEEVDEVEGLEKGSTEELGVEIENIHLEMIDGNKDGTKWLVINEVHICYKHKDGGELGGVVWRCSGSRRLDCKFVIVTSKPLDDESTPTVLKMSRSEIHTCSADKIAPLM